MSDRLPGQAPPEAGQPTVAVVGPFSGPRAQWGELLTAGALAVRGYPVRWEPIDDRGEAERAARIARRVVGEGRFAAVLGHFNSTGAALALPVYRAAGLPVLLPLATAHGLLKPHAGAALRFCPDDAGQAAAIVRACRRAGQRRLAVVHDATGYGRRLAELLTAAGGERAVAVHDGTAAGHGGPALDTPAGTARVYCGEHHRVAAMLRRHGPAPDGGLVVVSDDCDVPEFAGLAGPAAHGALVARIAGGPQSRVTAAFAALASALAKHPGRRGAELLAQVRGEPAERFDTVGDPLGATGGQGWEVVPVRPAAAPVTADERYDVAVVGAGIVGRAAALEAARAGSRVVLLDGGRLGGSASAVSGALLRAFEPGSGARELAIDSFRRLWGRADAGRYGFRRTGALTLLGPEHLADAEAGVRALTRARLAAELLDPAELSHRWPELDGRGLAGAVWEPHGGYAVAAVALAVLLDKAGRAGATALLDWELGALAAGPDGTAELRPATAATSTATTAATSAAASTTGSGSSGTGTGTGTGGTTATDRPPLRADVVLLATGCATPALLGDRLPELAGARTRRIRYGIFDRGGHTLPTLVDLVSGVWGRPDGADAFLAGCPVPEWEVPERSGRALTPAQVAAIRAGTALRLPFLAEAAFRTGAYGTDLYPPAGPALGVVPGTPRTVVACGFSGGGFKTGPAAGHRAALAAQQLRTGRPVRTARPPLATAGGHIAEGTDHD
ncbi:FAD-dependent oxidoreductase [Kitasatospora sp. NBC_01287]|uniref:FAD-dependent oxidoreductase n=1 Tax=Kitasatospora sp. NBC_01287 TaxID=2903573 RepID=UPI002254E1A1|nr:FAD-dependent oxidoreductase [Kitasatospora sp. NBC_01287]MCX4746940.1 FAD-dependent oxidoreductase [Kitasatospora sp. NBC_01287]